MTRASLSTPLLCVEPKNCFSILKLGFIWPQTSCPSLSTFAVSGSSPPGGMRNDSKKKPSALSDSLPECENEASLICGGLWHLAQDSNCLTCQSMVCSVLDGADLIRHGSPHASRKWCTPQRRSTFGCICLCCCTICNNKRVSE